MKKILLINLFVCMVVGLEALYIINEKEVCNMHCSSGKKDIKLKEIKVQGGSETDDPVFSFNRVYIKM